MFTMPVELQITVDYLGHMIDRSIQITPQSVVAWDFDGVLNRNVTNGRFIWADSFEADIGHSLDHFTEVIFHDGFDDVITGKADLRERVRAWADEVGYTSGPDALLDYWFKKDSLPDPDVGNAMDDLKKRGIRQIIVTNNEVRRTNFIEFEMGFGKRVERIFTSGRMGVRKPDPAFFNQVTDALGVEAKHMILIDDCPNNVPAAIQSGWQAFQFVDETRDSLRCVLGVENASSLSRY